MLVHPVDLLHRQEITLSELALLRGRTLLESSWLRSTLPFSLSSVIGCEEELLLLSRLLVTGGDGVEAKTIASGYRRRWCGSEMVVLFLLS